MHKSSHELMIGSCSNVGQMVTVGRNGYFSGFHISLGLRGFIKAALFCGSISC